MVVVVVVVGRGPLQAVVRLILQSPQQIKAHLNTIMLF